MGWVSGSTSPAFSDPRHNAISHSSHIDVILSCVIRCVHRFAASSSENCAAPKPMLCRLNRLSFLSAAYSDTTHHSAPLYSASDASASASSTCTLLTRPMTCTTERDGTETIYEITNEEKKRYHA